MKTILFLVGLLIACVSFASTARATDGIQIRPLIYRETLTDGQVKKGVVDIANPTNKKLSLHITIKLFRQITDDGKLEFYDKPDVTAAIIPEYTDFELEAKDALRLNFTVDASKLPEGDVFAALFATTQPAASKGREQMLLPAVQVGTLLVFQNGQVGTRHTEISDLQIPFFQFGTAIQGRVSVTNPANTNTSTGFFPKLKVTTLPMGPSKQFEGPLVYSGRTRSVNFDLPTDQFGFYKIVVTANDVVAERYVFVMTGIYRFILPAIFVGIVIAGGIGWRWYHRSSAIHFKKR